MKKLKRSFHYCIICNLFFLNYLSAQIQFGLTGGFNLSKVNFENTKTDFSTRFRDLGQGAILLRMSTYQSKKFFLQYELGYSERGYNVELSDKGGLRGDFNFNYFDLGIHLYNRIGKNRFTINCGLGGIFSYAMYGQRELPRPGGLIIIDPERVANYPTGLNPFDINLSASFALEAEVGRTSLFLESRYQYGLFNFKNNSEPSTSTSSNIKAYHRNLGFRTGIYFPIKAKE